eukprot:TRINITY_DN8463_c0_g1_i1.p1 TRINITY_DN8463_c0_g1~~TRINITY_DN8463_c0_g1_i1.p1  ORF type:complete len:290 (+),score=99.78 TRINITY_DN8463_c0_g1_i1:41-871(+)
MFRRSAARLFTKRTSGLVLVDNAGGDDRIAVVTLNNPDKLNALTVDMGNEFATVVKDLKADKDLRGVVVTGAGRAFSAGGDLAFLRSRVAVGAEDTTHALNKEEMLRFYARFLSLKTLEVPVIAAINGHAVGAGLCMAMAADIRIAAADAKLSVNFTRIGIHPGMAASYHLPRLVGPQRAAQMILTGAPVLGEESVPMGLCLKALPADEVLPASISLMKEIVSADAMCTNQAVLTIRSGVSSQHEATDRESTCQSFNFREGGHIVASALDAMTKRS